MTSAKILRMVLRMHFVRLWKSFDCTQVPMHARIIDWCTVHTYKVFIDPRESEKDKLGDREKLSKGLHSLKRATKQVRARVLKYWNAHRQFVSRSEWRLFTATKWVKNASRELSRLQSSILSCRKIFFWVLVTNVEPTIEWIRAHRSLVFYLITT